MSTQSATTSVSRKIGNPTAPAPIKPSASESDLVLRVLKRKSGVGLNQLCKLTGWQIHSVRGFLSVTVRKKLGHELIRLTEAKGVARYSIGKTGAAS